jgi:hypothetical protein
MEPARFSSRSLSAAGLNRVPRPLLALAAGIAPAVITLILLGSHLHVNLFDFRPTTWNDQVYYWHQIATFKEAGFNGGYYTVHEALPRLEVFHFGASGPFYPALFGLVARVIGWQPYTGILLNMVLIALAAWAFIRLARLNRLQIVLTGAALLAVTPVLMFMPTISQESFHQAAALLLAGIFYRLFRQGDKLPPAEKLAILVFLAAISLLRFSWLLLLPPCLLLMRSKNSWPQSIGALAVAGILGTVVVMIFQFSSAPGNNSVFAQLNRLGQSPFEGVSNLVNYVILGNARGSFLNIADLRQLTPDILQGIQFSVVLVAVTAFWLKFSRDGQALFHVYNLTLIWLASLVFYLPDGYYRLFAPHLLLTLLLLIVSGRYTVVVAVVVAGLLGTGIFLDGYRLWMTNFQRHPDQADVADVFGEYLVYQPEASNPWCNTLLVSSKSLNYRMTFVPPGIGVSFYIAPDLLTYPLKSRYLFITEAGYQLIKDRLRVERLAVTPGFTLYHNLDADCD